MPEKSWSKSMTGSVGRMGDREEGREEKKE